MLKHIEIAFRKFLITVLSKVVRRRRSIPATIDFNSSTFLFVRQDRIGDVLISTPLFHALKRRYPQANVDVLLSLNNQVALAHDGLIRKRWIYRKGLRSTLAMIRGIRKERYDFVIDLMDNPSATSTVICLLSGSRWTVGLEKNNSYAYDVVVPLLSRKDTHIVDRIAQLLVPFGIDPAKEDLRIHFCVTDSAAYFARNVLKQFGLSSGKSIGINISAGHDVRFWGVDNFRALISLLREKSRKRPILLLYKPSHAHYAGEIAAGFENVCVSPPTESFEKFAALISVLGLLITPDTSAVHLAAAFNIPSVVLYVQSDKALRIWEPYRSPSVNLVADIDDLRVISPKDVAHATARLSARRNRTKVALTGNR